VQTTLLGFGIALVLALVAALVGPLYYDWDGHRDLVDDWLGHITGFEVRVGGKINARFLPTPTLTAQEVEFGRRGDSKTTRARELRVELAPGSLIGSLIGGEVRATVVTLRGPHFALTLDRSGQLDWSASMADSDIASIEQLEIEDGSLTLNDAASDAHLSLNNLKFAGQVRSLIGPVQGEGSFELDGQAAPLKYRLVIGRRGDDGVTKVHFSVNPPEGRRLAPADSAAKRPISFDIDGSLRIEGAPQFEGTLQWAGVPGMLEGLTEPWRVAGHLHLDPAKAQLDQINLQYGAEERAAQLRGEISLTRGAMPALVATLSSSQIDLDRILGPAPAGGRRPQLVVRNLADSLAGTRHPPFGVQVKLNADAVTLAGAMLSRLEGELSFEGAGWRIKRFSLRAPGLTQVDVDGRLNSTPGGAAFEGSAQIHSDDPRALAAWLADGGDTRLPASGPLHLESQVALGGEKMVFDKLQVKLDRMQVEGHVEYAWHTDAQPAKLVAKLHAPNLDIDRMLPLLSAAFGDPSLEWPRATTLALDIRQVTWAGIEAKDISINLRGDADGLVIEPSFIGNIGGARLTLAPGDKSGKIEFGLDGRSVDGVVALIDKFSPMTADRIRRAAGPGAPVNLRASLEVPRQGAGAASRSAPANMELQGSAGALGLDLKGEANGVVLTWASLAKLGTSKVRLHGSVVSGDGSVLLKMLGLDELVTVDYPAGLAIDVSGPLDGELEVKEATLHSRDIDVSAHGSVHIPTGSGPTAQLDVTAFVRNVVAFRDAPSARLAQLPWSSLRAKLALANDVVSLTDLSGSAAGVEFKGGLDIALSSPLRIDGDLKFAALDLPGVVGAAIGFPHEADVSTGAWPQVPFEPGLLGSTGGQIRVGVDELALPAGLVASNVAASIDFASSGMKIEVIDGRLAGGGLRGHLNFARGDDGIRVDGDVRLGEPADVADPANVAAFLGGDSLSPVSGKLKLDLTMSGVGRSPFALVSSLEGKGTIAWRNGALERFDPGVFDAMTRTVDQDLQTDANSIGERIEAAFAARSLPVSVEAAVALDAGQFRLVEPAVQASGADVSLVAASADLVQGVINTRMVVSPTAMDGATERRPGVSLSLVGSIGQLSRMLDTSALANWLAQRHADALERVTRTQESEAIGSAEPEPVTLTAPSVAPSREPLPPREDPTSAGTAPPRESPPDGAALPAPAREIRPPRQRPAASTPLFPPPLDIRPPAAHPPRG
jgi:large subunit ribosomal protein L24